MSLSSFSGDVDVIAGLGDTPTIDDNLTTAQFKAKFDYAANLIKTYINSTLVPYINNTLLAKVTGTAGVVKTNSSGVLSAGQIARADIANSAISTDQLADRSITAVKIGSYQITDNELHGNCVVTSKIADGAVTKVKLGSDVDYEAVGVHVVTAVPTSSSPDGIYLVVSS